MNVGYKPEVNRAKEAKERGLVTGSLAAGVLLATVLSQAVRRSWPGAPWDAFYDLPLATLAVSYVGGVLAGLHKARRNRRKPHGYWGG